MSIAQRAVSNTFWLFISEVCSRAIMFLGTLYLARVLGVEGFGLYSLALALAAYLWTVVDMGVTDYGTREIARNKEGAKELFSILSSLRLIISIVSFLCLWAILQVPDITSQTRLVLLAGGFYVVANALSPDWILKGLERMEYIALGNLAVGISFLGSIYLLIESPADTAAAAFYRSLSFSLASLVTLIILKKKLGVGFSFIISPSSFWVHIKESWSFAAKSGLFIIGKFIPLFFLGFWATATEVGIFSAPHRLISLLIYAFSIIQMAAYPIFSNIYVVDKDKFQEIHHSLQRLVLFLSLPIATLGAALSEDIITILYGSSYFEASGILKIMVCVIPLTLLRFDYSKSLLSAGHQYHNMIANGIGVIGTTIICLILVPSYGGYGATIAILLGEIITLIAVGMMYKIKVYRFNPFDFYFIRVIAASVAVGIIISNINSHVVLKFATGIVSYLVLSFILGIVTIQHVQKLYQTTISGKRNI